MSNHVHLLITPREQHGAANMMQRLNRTFVRTINERYGRTGTLWEGRYRSAVIDSERYLLACSRYIEMNPVRAGMVGNPGEYRWSSFAHNALGTADPVLQPHSVYLGLSSDPAGRREAYRALFDEQRNAPIYDLIRRATFRGTFAGDVVPRRLLSAPVPPMTASKTSN